MEKDQINENETRKTSDIEARRRARQFQLSSSSRISRERSQSLIGVVENDSKPRKSPVLQVSDSAEKIEEDVAPLPNFPERAR